MSVPRVPWELLDAIVQEVADTPTLRAAALTHSWLRKPSQKSLFYKVIVHAAKSSRRTGMTRNNLASRLVTLLDESPDLAAYIKVLDFKFMDRPDYNAGVLLEILQRVSLRSCTLSSDAFNDWRDIHATHTLTILKALEAQPLEEVSAMFQSLPMYAVLRLARCAPKVAIHAVYVAGMDPAVIYKPYLNRPRFAPPITHLRVSSNNVVDCDQVQLGDAHAHYLYALLGFPEFADDLATVRELATDRLDGGMQTVLGACANSLEKLFIRGYRNPLRYPETCLRLGVLHTLEPWVDWSSDHARSRARNVNPHPMGIEIWLEYTLPRLLNAHTTPALRKLVLSYSAIPRYREVFSRSDAEWNKHYLLDAQQAQTVDTLLDTHPNLPAIHFSIQKYGYRGRQYPTNTSARSAYDADAGARSSDPPVFTLAECRASACRLLPLAHLKGSVSCEEYDGGYLL
ncbi:hypothetical protein MKEN_00953500 [Mycena kentingensis (nom. inval.)]|nr:hypothetical protein MKEN_00953500 [Mycena kentingensis (nom. inval.)]